MTVVLMLTLFSVLIELLLSKVNVLELIHPNSITERDRGCVCVYLYVRLCGINKSLYTTNVTI